MHRRQAAPGRLAPQYMLELIVAQFVLLNPAVAILAVASAEKRAVVRNDQIVARTMLSPRYWATSNVTVRVSPAMVIVVLSAL